MNLPYSALTLDLVPGAVTGPLSIRGVAELIERLPAADRAALAWAPTSLQSGIQPLLEGPLTRDKISSASLEVFGILARLFPAVTRLVGAEQLSVQVDAASRSELDRLRRFLPDDGARRSADWVFRALRAFMGVFSRVPHSELVLVAAGEKPITEADIATFQQDDAIGLFNGLVLIMAAMSMVEQAGEPERAAELCDLAFLETSRGVDSFEAAGWKIMDESAPITERGSEILQIVEDVRMVLTSEDIETLSVGRLRDLR